MKQRVQLPEEIALCMKRILEEKETQANFNGVSWSGLTLNEIVEETQKRLGMRNLKGVLSKAGIK